MIDVNWDWKMIDWGLMRLAYVGRGWYKLIEDNIEWLKLKYIVRSLIMSEFYGRCWKKLKETDRSWYKFTEVDMIW